MPSCKERFLISMNVMIATSFVFVALLLEKPYMKLNPLLNAKRELFHKKDQSTFPLSNHSMMTFLSNRSLVRDIVVSRKSPSVTPDQKMSILNLREVLEGMPRGDVLFSFGNKDHQPFHLHWVCNTIGWPGLHERTLLAVSDTSSQDAIRKLSNRVHTVVVPESSRTHGFYSKGYRMLTIRRVAVLVEILASGRGVILFEGDALWTSNILDDENIAGPNRSHDAALYRDGQNGELIGAGLMAMKGNRSGAYTLWKLILNRLNADMTPFARKPDSTVIKPHQAKHEQEILRQEILPGLISDGKITVFDLDRCLYASGLWYRKKAIHVQMCGSTPPAVLNNNWIIGNEAKILRAKSAKHWFLDGSKCADWKTTLQRALETFKP